MFIKNNSIRLFLTFFIFPILWISCNNASDLEPIEQSIAPETTVIEGRYLKPVFDELIIQKDVVYGTSKNAAGLDEDLKMDIYQPKGDTQEARPLVVLAHGGSFIYGDKEDMSETVIALAKMGYVAATINYRINPGIAEAALLNSPEVPLMTIKAGVDAIFDSKAAVRFFSKDSEKENLYKINQKKIFFGGYSAGAFIALHYGFMQKNELLNIYRETPYIDLIKSILLENGVSEADDDFEGNSGNAGYSSSILGVINISGGLIDLNIVDKEDTFPLFSIHGTADTTVPYEKGVSDESGVQTYGSKLIHNKRNDLNITSELYTIDGGGHDAFQKCEDCISKIATFISNHLN